MKQYGILLVLIFDGRHPPVEKTKERAKRRENSAKQISKVDYLRKVKKLAEDIVEVGGDTVSEEEDSGLVSSSNHSNSQIEKNITRIRNLLDEVGFEYPLSETGDFGEIIEYTPYEEFLRYCKIYITMAFPQSSKGVQQYDNLYDIVKYSETKIEKVKTQSQSITDEFKEQARKIAEFLGFPSFTAYGEAEALCAYLNISGHVDGVITDDTDVLPYGDVNMFRFTQNIKFYKGLCQHVSAIYLRKNILGKGYELNKKEFRKMCVLLRCDYNKNNPAFRIRSDWKKLLENHRGESVGSDSERNNISRASKPSLKKKIKYTNLGPTSCIQLFRKLIDLELTLSPEICDLIFEESTLAHINLKRCCRLLSKKHIKAEKWPLLDYAEAKSTPPLLDELADLLLNERFYEPRKADRMCDNVRQAWTVNISESSPDVFVKPIVASNKRNESDQITQDEMDDFFNE